MHTEPEGKCEDCLPLGTFKVRVTLDFSVRADTFLDAQEEVKILIEQLRGIQNDVYKEEDHATPVIAKYQVWAQLPEKVK